MPAALEPFQLVGGAVDCADKAGFEAADDEKTSGFLGKSAERDGGSSGFIAGGNGFRYLRVVLHLEVELGGLEAEKTVQTPAGIDDGPLYTEASQPAKDSATSNTMDVNYYTYIRA